MEDGIKIALTEAEEFVTLLMVAVIYVTLSYRSLSDGRA